MTDHDLLRSFVRDRDERAFRQIVERYLRLVYVAARRQVRDDHAAEDVAQAVFIILARKAASLRDGTVLAGWLVHTARLTAKTATRAAQRRKRHEQRVADMNAKSRGSGSSGSGGGDPVVEGLSLLELDVDRKLDDALARLAPADRTAVTLRYLQGLSLREVGEAMGTSEAAASKRVARAVLKMREMFRRQGLDVAPAVLTGVMARQASIALPPTISAPVTATAALHAAQAATAATTAAAAIAHAVLAAALWKAVAGVTAAVLLLSASIAGAAVMWNNLQAPARRTAAVTTQSSNVAPATSAAAAGAAREVPNERRMRVARTTGPVRVGVYVSLNTALVKAGGGGGGARVWQSMFRIVNELDDPQLDLVPLVEPFSDADKPMAAMLAQTFPGRKPALVTDPDALRNVDVIIAASVCYPTDDALAAIESAVRDGVGIVVRQCLGGDDKGYRKPAVRNLRLLRDARPDAIRPVAGGAASVVGAHPLLGSLSGQTNKTIPIRAYGGYGALADGATPLLQLNDTAAVIFDSDHSPVAPVDGYGVYPLAVGRLGSGRVVSCGFSGAAVPKEFDDATGGQFSIRAVRWAAGRTVQ